MTERVISIDQADLLELYGINNRNLDRISAFFSTLKIVARGNEIKVSGDETEVERFADKIRLLTDHLQKFHAVTEYQLDRILEGDSQEWSELPADTNGVLLFGVNGKPVRAFTPNQRKMVEEAKLNDLLFAVGPAGTGKTYTAIALAVRALKNKEIKKIILSRPAVEAGENLGYLPGDLKEKLDPYLQPLYDALQDMIPFRKLAEYMEERIIEIAPLAFMRGRTLDNAFVILDEGQNATVGQLKMFLTRMGRNARFIVTGDLTQIDLPKKQNSGLLTSIRLLKNIEGISVIEFDAGDISRHKLVKKIVAAYEAPAEQGEESGS
jgi:phosphate starvation-inducible protein PhoH and related proteins